MRGFFCLWPIAAALALSLSACSSKKNPLPPPLKGNAIDDPVSCSDLQSGQIVEREIHLDGGVPACGADGLRCPLSNATPAMSKAVCGSRSVVALCQQNHWTLGCEAPPDASTKADAGDAATADAAAGDAATDAGVG